MSKSLKFSLTISETLILFICYFTKRNTLLKHFRGIGLTPMDATCWVSEGEDIKTSYSTGSSWRPLFHCLLSFTFVTFLILWPLSPAASIISWCWSCFVCSELAYEIYSGGGPSLYVYCVVCCHMMAAPYSSICKKCCCVFTHHYTLDDDLECSMECKLYFILLKVFTLKYCPQIPITPPPRPPLPRFPPI